MTWYLDANRFIYDSLFVLCRQNDIPQINFFMRTAFIILWTREGGGGFCDYVDNQINAYITHIFIYFS